MGDSVSSGKLGGVMSNRRLQVLQILDSRRPRRFEPLRNETGRRLKVSEYFGCNVFDLPKMKEKLPRDVFIKLTATIESGKTISSEIADSVAHAIKEWALGHEVTHFCHWFQPQTGATAEKHDAFLSLDGQNHTLEKFTGSQLIQSEPDASSFPSGGMRTTFEARGYTAWDPSSPVFIMEHTNGKTLCIPSVFISYYGDALDEKTGLLRSMEALSQKSCELLQLLGDTDVTRVIATLGVEQEYFLLDQAYFSLRPDLEMTGRTLLGGEPPKGQQLEDHYFGSIPSRVQAYMCEVEHELFKLGVPVKTRHNEVAPNQFEIAPIFEEANLASDHNHVTMEILRKVATRHQLSVLLHEKPFAGINGSGKHNNWSLSVASKNSRLYGENLLDPGKTPHQNLRFLTLLCGILKGVHQHAGLLRAGIASSGNDHRLGANEAPPAIISVFMGDLLSRILNDLEKGVDSRLGGEAAVIKLGVSQLPEVMRDNTDRNRTSPLAFTGNKFEFRAVGSSAAVAFPVTLLNTAVADGFAALAQTIQKRMKKGETKDTAVLESLRETIQETRDIRFEGNNYSNEWLTEAGRRGLPHFRRTPEALSELITEKSINLMKEYSIFSDQELHSRYHVRMERYIKNMLIEVETLKSLVDVHVLPAAYSYQSILAESVSVLKSLGIPTPQIEVLSTLTSGVTQLLDGRKKLDKRCQQIEQSSNEDQKARILSGDVFQLMLDIRQWSDRIESLVADELWPLPKYREILSLK